MAIRLNVVLVLDGFFTAKVDRIIKIVIIEAGKMNVLCFYYYVRYSNNACWGFFTQDMFVRVSGSY